MYSEFFLKRLTDAAPVLSLFKKGLEAIDDNWPDVDIEHDKLDDYAIIDKVFNLLEHNFDEQELAYIYSAVYAQAGASASLEYISSCCGDKLNIAALERIQPNGRFYDIRVNSTEEEYIKNFLLFEQAFRKLVEDLLYFNGVEVGMYSLTFEVHIKNNSVVAEQQRVTSHKYAYFPADILSNQLFIVNDLGD